MTTPYYRFHVIKTKNAETLLFYFCFAIMNDSGVYDDVRRKKWKSTVAKF